MSTGGSFWGGLGRKGVCRRFDFSEAVGVSSGRSRDISYDSASRVETSYD